MNISKENISRLLQSAGVSGYEWQMGIPQVIQDLLNEKGSRIGNNLVYRLGYGRKKIFISAHLDEVGFIITNRGENYCRIVPIGSNSPANLIGKKLIFDTRKGTKTSLPIKKSKSFSDVKAYFKNGDFPAIGDVGTFEKRTTIAGDIVIGPGLDNKSGCLALISAYKKLREAGKITNKTLIFCFASREEQSANGVMSAINIFKPNICIDIDSAYAQPIKNINQRKNWRVPEIGKGTAIQLLGKGFVIAAENRKLMEKLCIRNNIKFQYEIPDGDNGGTFARTYINNGYDTFQINIPVANQHSAISKTSLVDIDYTTRLLVKLLTGL